MITFFLGAGASVDYGFPQNPELRELLLKSAKNGLFRKKFNDGTRTDRFRNILELSPYSTPDELFADRPSIKDLGRWVVAHTIATCEQNCRKNLRSAGGWYGILVRWLLSEPGVDYDKIKIITLNYDRSLEFFFRNFYTQLGDLEESRWNEIYPQIEIVHAHGSSGDLDQTEFGKPQGPIQSNQIRFVSDPDDPLSGPHENQKRALEILGESSSIYVIGFAFHEALMKAYFSNISGDTREVVSTYKGFNTTFVQHLKKQAPRLKFYKGLETAEDMMGAIANSNQGVIDPENYEHLSAIDRSSDIMNSKLR